MNTILLIDDDRDLLKSVTSVLEVKGYETLTATNRNDGVKLARKMKPDLILLDVMMDTDTDGFHTAYDLRKDEGLKYTPILMLTSVNQKTGFTFDPDKDGAFLPVDGFFEKPRLPLHNAGQRKGEIRGCSVVILDF